MDNKRFKVYIAIFVTTTVIASCFAVYFAIKLSNKDVENTTVGKVESVATDEVDKKETNVEIKEVEKIVEKYAIPTIDASKCLNPTDGYKYDVKRNVSGLSSGFHAFLESETLVKIDYTPATISGFIPELGLGNEHSATVKEISFSGKKVKDIYFDGWGHAVGYETLFFIMDDGTVEYMPLYDAIKNNKFTSYGKIDGVEKVVEILSGNVGYPEMGGAAAVFAVTEEGSFYDISIILNSTENYKYAG